MLVASGNMNPGTSFRLGFRACDNLSSQEGGKPISQYDESKGLKDWVSRAPAKVDIWNDGILVANMQSKSCYRIGNRRSLAAKNWVAPLALVGSIDLEDLTLEVGAVGYLYLYEDQDLLVVEVMLPAHLSILDGVSTPAMLVGNEVKTPCCSFIQSFFDKPLRAFVEVDC